ncbi:MAG: flagellar basal body rod protein FlgC [bacterium]|mgnify:CR=1 FL=1|jgi:flagellar basal-body rod protein FlgC|nr:flagellar basal body rod protein FlgC [Bacillota bacterium]
MFSSFNISASGLTAQRLRLDIISNNLANVETTQTASGGPYRRQLAIFGARDEETFGFYLGRALSGQAVGGGVRVLRIEEDSSPPRRAYQPGHPDADEEGYVLYPNVNVVTEMVDMISASRSYEANAAAFNATKSMVVKALELGRR